MAFAALMPRPALADALPSPPTPLPPPPPPPAIAAPTSTPTAAALPQLPPPDAPPMGPAARLESPSTPSDGAYHGPYMIDAESGRRPPPGYRETTRVHDVVMAWGAVLFGFPYLVSASIGLGSRGPGNGWMVVPLVGPIATAGAQGAYSDNTGYALDALAQVTGATMFFCGLAFPTRVWVRDFGPANESAAHVTVMPMRLGHGGAGLALVGEL
jgi:hypothetical protein